MSADTLMSAEQLIDLSIPGKRIELIEGRLIVRERPGTRHGAIAGELFYRLADFARRHRSGLVVPQDTGFKIERNPDTVRAPDVAFLSAERAARVPDEGYAELAPDLVVEVVSNRYRPGELLAKIGEWLDAGSRLVWVVDPGRSEVRVHRADGSLAMLGREDTLDGEDVLPGFSCRVGEILGRAGPSHP